jgi:hypothetical protein
VDCFDSSLMHVRCGICRYSRKGCTTDGRVRIATRPTVSNAGQRQGSNMIAAAAAAAAAVANAPHLPAQNTSRSCTLSQQRRRWFLAAFIVLLGVKTRLHILCDAAHVTESQIKSWIFTSKRQILDRHIGQATHKPARCWTVWISLCRDRCLLV